MERPRCGRCTGEPIGRLHSSKFAALIAPEHRCERCTLQVGISEPVSAEFIERLIDELIEDEPRLVG